MKDNVIYHNPRCSKSRAALALLQKRDIDVEIIEYLQTPPNAPTLLQICKKLKLHPTAIMRVKEERFKELGLDLSDERSPEEWADIIARNPVLLERPIVLYRGKAALGRPPEDVLRII